MNKYRFGVSTKLFLAFTLFTAAVIFAGMGSIFYINKMGDLFKGIYEENMVSLNSVNSMQADISEIMISTYRYLGTQDPDNLKNIENLINRDTNNIHAQFDEKPDKYQEVKVLFEQLAISRKKAMDYHFNFNTQQAYEEINSNGQKSFLELQKLISSTARYEKNLALDRLKDGLDIKEGIIIYLIAVIIVRILLNSTIAFLVFKSITRPLIELVNFIGNLHKTSDFSQRITIKHKDEMGDAARAINGLAGSLEDIINNISVVLKEYSSGNFEPRIENALVGDLEKLKTSINTNADQSRQTISNINHVMDRVSKGDFSHRINTELKGEFNNLKNNVNSTVDQLSSSINKLHDEINERIAAEKKLKETSTQLIELSRHVGRADIATSTLHNVGNVLNSLSTSSHSIADCIQKLDTSSQEKLISTLNSKGNELSTYLSQPDKSKLFLSYLEKNNDLLRATRTELTTNNERLKQHITHLNRIISSQQEYAKLSNFDEEINLNDTIEIAIELSGIIIRNIHVGKEYMRKPDINFISDKDKVLQILTNLFNNAKHAIADKLITTGEILIDINKNDNNTFTITVDDNGVGIKSDLESKLFTLGFTTRKSGHGFGLHHSALMAHELGGKLNYENKGEGIGAIFSLTLPFMPDNGLDHE